MDGIVKIQMARLQKRLENQGFIVDFTDNLLKYLSEKGYDPIYGARPLKRVIQREVENILANKILKNEILVGKKVVVDIKGEKLVVR